MTSAIRREYLLHKQACQELGIPQSTYMHRKLKGTATTVAGTKNRVYRGTGPRIDLSVEVESTFQIWCVYQPFIRGEQRSDDEAFGMQATQIKQGQFAAVDDFGVTIPVIEDDLITDGIGTLWRVTNPVISPDLGFWTLIMERFR